jgi:protein subunit release factor A
MSNTKPKKELLFSLTKKNFVVEYFNGTGNGGQNRNKVAAACRIHHPESGALAVCQEERTQKENRERAFKRLVNSDKFQKWLKLETARKAGTLKNIDAEVERQMKNIKIEVRDENGKFTEVDDSYFDLLAA